ncbi:hypothetical protein QL285_002956 [Trifolium repens]|nr:hypothetical protein QL285_002956 [Trifolium repens]
MDRNNTKKNTVEKSESKRGEKKSSASASKPQRNKVPRKVKAKNFPVSSSSSSSDDIDEDYAEFLKTYVHEEFYVYASPPGEEEGSQITVESAAKMPESSKVKTSRRHPRRRG